MKSLTGLKGESGTCGGTIPPEPVAVQTETTSCPRRESPIRTRSRGRKRLLRRARSRPALRTHGRSAAIARASGDFRSRFGPKVDEQFTVSTTRQSSAASPLCPAHGSQPGAQAGRHARRGRGDSGRMARAPNGTQWHQLATFAKGSGAKLDCTKDFGRSAKKEGALA